MVTLKKYKLNYNLAMYDIFTGFYENNENKYQNFSEARDNKWKCEKCFKTYRNYKMLADHKSGIHAY